MNEGRLYVPTVNVVLVLTVSVGQQTPTLASQQTPSSQPTLVPQRTPPEFPQSGPFVHLSGPFLADSIEQADGRLCRARRVATVTGDYWSTCRPRAKLNER